VANTNVERVVALLMRKNYPQDYTSTTPPAVREANEAARAWLEPRPSSVWDRRIINHFISLNKPDDDTFKEHTIPVAEVERYLGYSLGAKEYAEIRESVKRLIRFALMAPSGKRGIKGGALFVAMEFDDDGNIQAKMNIELKKLFLELPSGFTVFELMEFNSLSSLYSQTLFPYLNSYKNLDCGYIDIDIDELHTMLGTPPTLRKDFSLFRIRILDPVQQEINEKTNIRFEWSGLKKIGGGKKIRAIRFRFLKPEPVPKALPLPEANGALYLDPEKTFSDRKMIRKLGGVYDGKRWYVPEGVSLRPFVGWMYEEDATNFLISQQRND
jgi:hypothetical protein